MNKIDNVAGYYTRPAITLQKKKTTPHRWLKIALIAIIVVHLAGWYL